MNSLTSYKVHLRATCPIEAYLRVKATNKWEAAHLTQRFLSRDCFDAQDESLYIRQGAFVQAVETGEYEIGDVLADDSGPSYPVLDRQRITALEINRSEPVP